ncbi:MAG: GIY-YIG nuclease family protein [Cyanobacteria bacterium P01_D01_bin.105]
MSNPTQKLPPSWSLYLIRTRTGALYTGITTDVAQRFEAHTAQRTGAKYQGAKYLRSKGPLTLVYQIEIGSHSLAAKAEYWLKKLTKPKKETIVAAQPDKAALLKLLKIQQHF